MSMYDLTLWERPDDFNLNETLCIDPSTHLSLPRFPTMFGLFYPVEPFTSL